MEYNFRDIEKKWREEWRKRGTYKVEEHSSKPKFYSLDMFPYPSGAGLHVGHPLGYIASDIVSRYKRLKGYNVLHPMGYDAFGLPAEQYAIQTGQHPAVTTEKNTARYREQLDQLGFCFDWSREVRTSDPKYYRWTQWIFLQLFNSFYDTRQDKARPISELIARFEQEGCQGQDASILTGDVEEFIGSFTATEWNAFDERTQQMVLQHFRLAYLGEAWVNWCPALGTVLANDEVKDGVSERGGHPVERKHMPQWSMRITAYAERLLTGLDGLEWTDALKEMQRNWIGRSDGATVHFPVGNDSIEVYTTRPDTLFGVTFLTLAPEHVLVNKFTTDAQRAEVQAYVEHAKNRSERERQADVEHISGVFTGSYATHPFTGKEVPVWVGDYVLAGYGTGAVMAVPGGDARDWRFAKHFDLPIIAVTEGADIENGADENKDATIVNSDFLNGLKVPEAIKMAIAKLEDLNAGEGSVNYRLRDAAFGRQRYWGEPIPIYYKDDIPYPIEELPLELPTIDDYHPTESGDPPLARAEKWFWDPEKKELVGKGEGYPVETTTMPGWAGSSWYFLRYMDPHNDKEFVSKEALEHWGQIDLYIGGTEHATGHLLYFRFWTKVLHDLGHLPFDEPAKKMINQGMIGGLSAKVLRLNLSPVANRDERFGLDSEKSDYFGEIERFANAPGPPIFISTDLYHDFQAELSKKMSEPSEVELLIRKEVRLHEEKINQMYPEAEATLHFGLSPESLVSTMLIPIECIEEDGVTVNLNQLRATWNDLIDAQFLSMTDKFFARREQDKMSKSKYNVVNPDDIIKSFGADTLRLYEMFLGPLEQHKPWDTNGIEGTHRFLRKLWRLFHTTENAFSVSEEAAPKEALKALHHTIKKVQDDIERHSFNTVVSEFMICVNKLSELKSNHREVLEPLVILLSPYAPHMAEELWEGLGHSTSVCDATFPAFEASYLVEDSVKYPVSFNGKMRFTVELSAQLTKEEVEKEVMAMEETAKYLNGGAPKKVIVVPKRIVNIVV